MDWCIVLQKMRSRRIERGALTLASAEVKFQIDTETHDPLDIGIIFLVLIHYFLFRRVQGGQGLYCLDWICSTGSICLVIVVVWDTMICADLDL